MMKEVACQPAMAAKNQNRTLVVGLGNPILGDDGVGWQVAEVVQRERPCVEIDFLALGGLSLMERLIGYQKVIIIDAIQTASGCTGKVTTIGLQDLPDFSVGHTTAVHDTSLQTALTLGREMGACLPENIQIVAIEAERVYDFSEMLSPAVAAAVPKAAAAVLALLDG